MRYLGIDYGQKRIGLALSDEGGTFAFPHGIIKGENTEEAIHEISKLVKKETITAIIVGLPLSSEGTKTTQTEAIEKFADELSNTVQLSIEFQNELLTSRMSERQGIGKENRDAASAALILQDYLDRKQK